MACIVVRGCAVSIALALAGGAVRAQEPESLANRKQAAQTSTQRHPRIISLLQQLAEQARASENITFAVRAQSQAAALLWTQDPEQARVIYRRAFQSLSPSGSTSARAYAPERSDASRGLTAAEKRQLRSELLNQITARDPVLAEELARDLAESTDRDRSGCGGDASLDCSSKTEPAASPAYIVAATREAAERRELLMSAALQIVERDPQQAMTFAQMSVALGLSPNLARLLTLLRNVDAERADLLFSNAMERLRQSEPASLRDIHTLGTYIVSVINSTTKQPLSKTLVVSFLNFAVNQIAQNETVLARSGRSDESAALYFIGRQLTDISARYGTDRLDQLQLYMSEATAYEQPIDLDFLSVSAPSEIARDARQSDDEDQRDSLYARAALAWLAEGDVKEAHAAALKITDGATRDRVLIQVTRRYAFEKRVDDGVALARRISDPVARVDVIVLLSDAALAAKDKPRAIELLSEAEACSIKSAPSVERTRSLVKIASSFSALDPVRGFEVLESAIKAINEIIKQQDSKEPTLTRARPVTAPVFTLDQLCSASLENTLTALAQADFDRALILAQQLSGEEAPVIAQLAVLKGGLAEKHSFSERLISDESVESGVNH